MLFHNKMSNLEGNKLNLTEAQTKTLVNMAGSEIPIRCRSGGDTVAIDRGTLYCENAKRNKANSDAGNYICLARGRMGHPCILNEIINLMYKALR